MKTLRIACAVAVCGLVGAPAVFAAPIQYQVVVNTSSLAGVIGSLDFQFNPGANDSQGATATLSGFTSNGTLLPPPFPTGDVTGTLPGTVQLVNDMPFNDYFEDFTFGSTLSFLVALTGPALSAPNGTASSGSSFAFSVFSDALGTLPALTTNTLFGFATTVDVNLDGSTTLTNFSSQTSAAAVPEPCTLLLFGTGLAGLWRARRRLAA